MRKLCCCSRMPAISFMMLSLVGDSVFAQAVRPMSYFMEPTGPENQQVLTIDNATEKTLTVEIEASAIEVDEDGVESRTPADEAFVIFPPLAVIEPGREQRVQVQYVGETSLSQSLSYRVSVKQVPVDLSQFSDNVVQVIVDFDTMAHIVPSGVSAKPIVQSIEDSAESGFWDLVLENKGKRYLALQKTEWSFESRDGKTIKVDGDDIFGSIKGKLVLPESVRYLQIPAPDGFVASDVSVNISNIQ